MKSPSNAKSTLIARLHEKSICYRKNAKRENAVRVQDSRVRSDWYETRISRLVSFSTRYAVRPTTSSDGVLRPRAQPRRALEAESRERPLYMGGPFFLRMHYISLVKFTLRTTGAGQTVGFVNYTRWPTYEKCGERVGGKKREIRIEISRCNISGRLNINYDPLNGQGRCREIFFFFFFFFEILRHDCIHDWDSNKSRCERGKIVRRKVKIKTQYFWDTLYIPCSADEYEIRRLWS